MGSVIRAIKGFTIAEMVVVLIVFGIIAVAIAPMMIGVLDLMIYDQLRGEIVADAQYVMNRVRSDIKGGLDNPCIFSLGPLSASRNHLRASEFDLYMDSGKLMYKYGAGMAESFQPLSSYVQSITFRYFDRDSNEITVGNENGLPMTQGGVLGTSQRKGVHSVRISMILKDPDVDIMPPIHLETEISPRNWNIGTLEGDS